MGWGKRWDAPSRRRHDRAQSRATSRASPRANTSRARALGRCAASASGRSATTRCSTSSPAAAASTRTKQLERYRDEGKNVVEIDDPDNTAAALAEAEAQTLAAMRAGADVIYQATFFDDGWRGHADFLLRVDTPEPQLGALVLRGRRHQARPPGEGRRAPPDVRLLRAGRAPQGVAPARDARHHRRRRAHPFTLTDYSAYYRTLKARFEELLVERARTTRHHDLSRSRRPLRHLPLDRRVQGPPPRRRPPLPRLRHAPRPDPQAHRRGHRHPRRARHPAAPARRSAAWPT